MKRLTLERKALRVIEILVSGDFAEDCELTLSLGHDFSQEEAQEMAKIIGRVYTIAHSAIKDHCCFSVHTDWREETIKLYNTFFMED